MPSALKRWLSVFCHTRFFACWELFSHKIFQNLNNIHLMPPHSFWCCEDSSKSSSASSKENSFLLLPVSVGYSHLGGYAVLSIHCPTGYFNILVLWAGCWAFCGWKRETDEISAELWPIYFLLTRSNHDRVIWGCSDNCREIIQSICVFYLGHFKSSIHPTGEGFSVCDN